MITLTLLHPLQDIPVQSWTFDDEPVIRIGRATDNHVVLYSAVVSRHHVEIRRNEVTWDVLNLGSNGTYLDGKRVNQTPIIDGAVIRLARSGPKIQIRIDSAPLSEKQRAYLEKERSLTPSGSEPSKDTLLIEKNREAQKQASVPPNSNKPATSVSPPEDEGPSTRPDLNPSEAQ
ncbi:FHA domain-containing protein [Desertifilum sp. FACHB-1129]|uniref:FHA domain-containing protein n=1 Tax=Desertifilum TaxID=1185872 RepID=UPI0009F395F7|nr:FHA domain-containing protein [Desertifilum tharense]MBD2310479.1 FHA domain-containing protein [Desertifilum sp. FACHB-1129]MBD2321931.1 FHA domain-containing protein [Desertifilum sp. FACHB-866]MBD2332058.1 FHA domain-containing protein [Desertifilum sp. FACHB-868]MDA0208997.1 FHA domain-containing protein [Cyanobacteria bacterium FC1]